MKILTNNKKKNSTKSVIQVTYYSPLRPSAPASVPPTTGQLGHVYPLYQTPHHHHQLPPQPLGAGRGREEGEG